MTRQNKYLAVITLAFACISSGMIAMAEEYEVSPNAFQNFAALDPLAQMIAPDLASIASENKASAASLAQQGALAAVFCPTHLRFETPAIDFSER